MPKRGKKDFHSLSFIERRKDHNTRRQENISPAVFQVLVGKLTKSSNPNCRTHEESVVKVLQIFRTVSLWKHNTYFELL